jgi:hypothetical protein
MELRGEDDCPDGQIENGFIDSSFEEEGGTSCVEEHV